MEPHPAATSARCGSSTPQHPDVPAVAAGAPWFMALFGRDSLLTAYMALLVDQNLALGTLQTLARLPGHARSTRSPRRSRAGSCTRCGSASRPPWRSAAASVYYGTADATPLFVMLLGELLALGHRRRRAGASCCRTPTARWSGSTHYGDRDGDGFVEYQRADRPRPAQPGLEGLLGRRSTSPTARSPRPPIALCEVQGYVYAALRRPSGASRDTGATATRRGLAGTARGRR